MEIEQEIWLFQVLLFRNMQLKNFWIGVESGIFGLFREISREYLWRFTIGLLATGALEWDLEGIV